MTIKHKEILNKWDGKFIVDEVAEYTDNRGSLVELWRSDDDKMNNDGFNGNTKPEMSYWSLTKPFMQRGAHRHSLQSDFFITWKSKMIYYMVNPDNNESSYFITDPQKIYRVKVAVPIIHSYRNLSFQDSLTGNFPTALFMGKDKKGFTPEQKIDEMRYEEQFEHNTNYWILGSSGRLGKAITKQFLNNCGMHKYNVIPVDIKLTQDNVEQFLSYLQATPNSVVINCMGKTNVQNKNDDFEWVNNYLPQKIAQVCAFNNIKMIHFSTNYVFHILDTSPYTRSKINFEDWLQIQKTAHQTYKDLIKIVRVANLFSLDASDTHNIISKLYNQKTIKYSPNIEVYPTEVETLAKWVLLNINSLNEYTNIAGKHMTIKELCDISSKVFDFVETEDKICGSKQYNQDLITLDCIQKIKEKYVQIHSNDIQP